MPELTDNIMLQFSEFIRKEIGLHFPENKFAELKQKLGEISKENGFKHTGDFIDFVIHQKNDSKSIAQTLASKLSVGETYFWRDRELFRALEEEILPEIIERKRNTRKSIRIWSAGSSSGEEAYSIAILLQRILPDIKNWNISIIATDINPKALEKAEKGVYTEWSFRSAPQWLKPNYFEQISDKEYKIDGSIREMVKFKFLNLHKDPYPSLSNNTNAMDLIFCRNVFIYFTLEDILKVSDQLFNCLVEKGILITTATESFQYLSPRYKIVHYRGITAYQRNADKEEAKSKLKEVSNAKFKINNKQTYTALKRKRLKNGNSLKSKRKEKRERKSVSKKQVPVKFEEIKDLYNQGEYQLAEAALEKLNEHSDQNSLLLQARIKANLGKLDEAREFCNKSIGLDKINPTAYFLLATIEAEKGNMENAYEASRKSFFLDSTFVINNYMLGNFARQLGKNNESVKHYQNSIDLLKKMDSESVVPESDGITAARLENIISMTLNN